MTNGQSEQVSNFLSRLDGVKRAGSGWQARCPCRNDDQNPSLSIGQGNDGRVLVTCHRGNSCNVEQICSSVGLRVADLMPPREAPQQAKREKLRLVKTYDYLDAEGTLLFQKLRYVDEDGKKTF
jgi:putative DNA primase/helicase